MFVSLKKTVLQVLTTNVILDTLNPDWGGGKGVRGLVELAAAEASSGGLSIEVKFAKKKTKALSFFLLAPLQTHNMAVRGKNKTKKRTERGP